MARDIFSLEGIVLTLTEKGMWRLLAGTDRNISDRIYEPDYLNSSFLPWRHKVKGFKFFNVSFRQTIVNSFEFEECQFERCLFVGTVFTNCRFTRCTFADSNMQRVEFKGCYADPLDFERCVPGDTYSNIGIYLFQELLRNSRDQAQPDFGDEAQYQFRKWQRIDYWNKLKSSNWRSNWISPLYSSSWRYMFEKSFAYGMRLKRVLLASFGILIFFTAINLFLADYFGICLSSSTFLSRFADAFYFSSVVITTLGFGDITPTETVGRVVISLEALSGFLLFALLTSTIYRRISS